MTHSKRLILAAVALLAIGAIAAMRYQHRAVKAHTVAPIADGKTMDFSSGKLVVKSGPAEDAALKKAVAEMDAAAGNVTFAPRATQTTGK